MNTHFPCHSLPGLPNCVPLRDSRELGCPMSSGLEDCWSQSQFNPFLPTHFFFPGDGGLKKMLFPLLREGSKEGMCCKCVRNGNVSIYTQSRMCCELHPPCLWHTDPRVGHASVRLFTHIFTCFVLSLWLHTASPHGCFELLRIK